MKFEKLAGYFDRVEKAAGRLQMMKILGELYRESSAEDIDKIVYLCQGQLAAAYRQVEVGMGEKFVMEAIAKTSGYSRQDIERMFKSMGDLGLVAEEVEGRKKQKALFSKELSVEKVFGNLVKIANVGGKGSQEAKIGLLAELLNSASAIEAKFIVRIPLGNLRLGIGDPTLMDAIASELVEEAKENKALLREIEKGIKEKKEEKRSEARERKFRMHIRERIEDKYNVHPDLGLIAKLLKEKGLKGLEKVQIEPGVPIRPSLAERLPSAEEIVKKLGRCAVESKYDGLRISVHKKGNEIEIFSRRQERMTEMFPEIVEAARKQIKAKEAIVDGEALAYNEEAEEFYPFQITMQRKRKYEIKEKAEEFPLKLFVFDVLYENGKSTMDMPFEERRERLKRLIGKGGVIELTKSIVTGNAKEMEEFFEENIGKGLEGIVAKDLKAKYIAGARKFAWIKLKRSYKGLLQDSVDVVILGYYKGKGLRAELGFGALLTGVYDEKADGFVTLARIGSGFSEEDIVKMKKVLDRVKRKEKHARVDSLLEADVWVEPKYVIEARADEITKSPMHTAGKKGKEPGYALRFPRMIKMREDKKAEEATSVKEILRMYRAQKHVKAEGVGA